MYFDQNFDVGIIYFVTIKEWKISSIPCAAAPARSASTTLPRTIALLERNMITESLLTDHWPVDPVVCGVVETLSQGISNVMLPGNPSFCFVIY